jgi:DNA-binding CsgD family transcriptional regulator
MSQQDAPPLETADMTEVQKRIAREICLDPWANNRTIADRAGCSRPYVSNTVKEYDELLDLRGAFQLGLRTEDPDAAMRIVTAADDAGQTPEGFMAAFAALAAEGYIGAVEVQIEAAEVPK